MPNSLPAGKTLQKNILLSVNDIPPLPKVLHQAREVINRPKSNIEDLSALIEVEPALAMKVLKIANSAYYRRFAVTSSIKEASVVLGIETLYELITIAGASLLLGNSLKGYDFSAESFWKHCLAVACGAKIIAARKYSNMAEVAFTAGLIHDVGKLILDRFILERKEVFDRLILDDNVALPKAEEKVLGFDHAEIATNICDKWHIPGHISNAIKFHHRPNKSGGNDLAYILHFADQLANWSGMDTDGIDLDMEKTFEERLGFTLPDIDPIMSEIVEYVDKIGADTLK